MFKYNLNGLEIMLTSLKTSLLWDFNFIIILNYCHMYIRSWHLALRCWHMALCGGHDASTFLFDGPYSKLFLPSAYSDGHPATGSVPLCPPSVRCYFLPLPIHVHKDLFEGTLLIPSLPEPKNMCRQSSLLPVKVAKQFSENGIQHHLNKILFLYLENHHNDSEDFLNNGI